jgi:hypothetical protein
MQCIPCEIIFGWVFICMANQYATYMQFYVGKFYPCKKRVLHRDGLPLLPPHHASWIDVVYVRARSRLTMSVALHGLDDKEIEAPSMPRTMPVVGYERPLRFSPMVQIVRFQTTQLLLSIFSKLGWKSSFPAIDLKARPAPSPVMASGGDHGVCSRSGSPRRDHCQPPLRRTRKNTSSSWASQPARRVFTPCWRSPGLASLS